MKTIERQKVIEFLFDEMTSSSFAEGCEERIARGLEARTDEQLIALAIEKMTWLPENQAHPLDCKCANCESYDSALRESLQH